MIIKTVETTLHQDFDKTAVHPLQSWPWGEFREKLGQKVIRLGKFNGDKLISGIQISVHKIPHTKWTIGYCPRGIMLDKEWISAIKAEVKKFNCIFVKFEPDVVVSSSRATVGSVAIPTRLPRRFALRNDGALASLGLRPGKPLFTPFTFQLDLAKPENELLAGMKSKTRYNIKLAQKKGVVIEEDNSDEAFEEFQKLTEETTNRQRFFAHGRRYRKLMWETMRSAGIARLFVARLPSTHQRTTYNVQRTILSAWILFFFNNTGYYPYGASSSQNRELMASNLLAWEALKLAKKSDCKMFDFWGSLGPPPAGGPDTKDPWYGFHKFKAGYGGTLVEFVGTWDLVISPLLYSVYKIVDKIRWYLLRNNFR